MIAELRQQYAREQSIQARIIQELIRNPAISQKELAKKLAVSDNTLKKTLTTVKDILWKYHAKQVSTPYDDAFVLRRVLFSGKTRSGYKFFNALIKESERRQDWQKMDALYMEGSRLTQITGDDAMISQITKKRKDNIRRLYDYKMLYTDIIREMIRLEGYAMRRPDIKKYGQYLHDLYQEAVRIGHHLLIHNALHIRYMFLVRYNDDPQKVFEVISEQKDNVKRHRLIMSDLTYAIALNNYVNFLVIYRNFGSPEAHARELSRIIQAGGHIASVNFYYSMLEYSLYEKKLKDVQKWMAYIGEDNSKFAQYKYIVLAIKAFIERDLAAFKSHFAGFYRDPSYLDFPDMEITLRLLELIILVHKKDHDLAMARIEALRMYIGRNAIRERHAGDRQILLLLSKINEGSRQSRQLLKKFDDTPYRSVSFIVTSIKSWLMPGHGEQV